MIRPLHDCGRQPTHDRAVRGWLNSVYPSRVRCHFVKCQELTPPSLYFMRRISLILIGLLLIAINAQQPCCFADSDSITNSSSITSKPLRWRTEAPFIRIGASEDVPIWAHISAPVEVVHAASAALHSDPNTWTVIHEEFGPQNKEIVSFVGRPASLCFTCLIESKTWIHLNEPEALPEINLVLQKSLTSIADLSDPGKAMDYIEDIAYLYKGPRRVVLSHGFFKLHGAYLSHWLSGSEKDTNKFLSLCNNPALVVKGNHFKLKCNIIDVSGGVENWTIAGDFTDSAHITAISIHQVCPAGTYTYGLVG